MDNLNCLSAYYDTHDEDKRLISRHGQVEFLTTVRYIGRYLKPGMRMLEIGAGTGRYAHYYARQGYPVDAVELVQHNIEVFSSLTEPGEAVTITQGSATDLSFIASGVYDITLLLGPMYHLFTREDKRMALSEAIRVTRPGGVVFVAYCIADASIIKYGFVMGELDSFIEKSLLNTETFRLSSHPQEIFELHRKEDIDELMALFDVEQLHYVASDGFTKHIQKRVDEMDDRTFDLYLRYHFTICERPDMVGITHHSLDIFRRKEK